MLSLSKKQAKQSESDLFFYSLQGLKREVKNSTFAYPYRTPEWSFYEWNSSIIQVSGLLISVFSVLILLSLVLALRNMALFRTFSTLANSLALASGLMGSVGLLLSSVALYVCYKPYAEIFDRFVLQGDIQQTRFLGVYDSLDSLPFGLEASFSSGLLGFYAWWGATIVFVFALAVMVFEKL